jgi:GntR family transcriptional regulator, galactonate operon transcriptional repressor
MADPRPISGPTSVKLKTLHRTVLDRLATNIISGQYPVGEAIPTEAELCKSLSVGRSTLREAIRVLVDKGILEVRTRNGTRVRPRQDWRRLDADLIRWTFGYGPDPSLFADLIEARRIFEPAAAALAARRADAGNLARIEENYLIMARTMSSDLEQGVEADIGFHIAVLAASGNSVLMEFETVIDTALRAAFRYSAQSTHSHQKMLDCHRAVYEAIRLRQPDVARTAMLELLNLAEHDLYVEPPRAT